MSDHPDPLREYRVRIIPAERAGPGVGYPANIGRRTKFGGRPDFIQPADDDAGACGVCFQRMHFVGQINSFEYDGPDNPNRQPMGDAQFVFGDVGMIYVWFCFHCHTPRATLQGY